MNRPVALVTNVGLNALAPDDVPLVLALEKIGIVSVVVSWDDPKVDWTEFELVVLRSCWNYHLKWVDFQRWLNLLEALKVRVRNSVPLLRWNMSKTYLLELAALGVAIPPTVSVDHRDSEQLTHILARRRWKDAVVKPTISASAYATSRVSLRTAAVHEDMFLELRRGCGVLVQEFVPEVVEQGELSFVFLDGNYSHAVLKTPKTGDFRVQTDFGGARALTAPDEKLISQAYRILSLAARDAAYARIDAVDAQGQLVLMELELIDPVLFFGFKERSEALLARSIEKAIA